MLRRPGLLATLALLLAAPAWAQDATFDERRLLRDDARFVQAALAYVGTYLGRIDGDWGAMSSDALRAAAGPRPSEIVTMEALLPFVEDFETAGWKVMNPEGTSLFYPNNLVSPSEGGDYWELATADRSLVIRYLWRDGAGSAEMHDWLETAHVGREPLYRADTVEAFITRGEIESGKQVYLRTIGADGFFETVLVQWELNEAPRARVVVASLSNYWVEPLTIRDGGYLDEVIGRLEAAPSPPDTNVAGGRAPREVGLGTAFYVNGTDLVSAAHVVERCARLTLADGSALLLLSADPVTDVAVLRAARRSAAWLELASDADTVLGAPAIVIGYPYAGLFNQGLSVTRGNVSALRGLSGEGHVMMLTAPVQPGNSGGPLLNDDGQVIGVISYRASDLYAMERSGTVPQNMNAATRLDPLRAVLKEAEIDLPVSSRPRHDLARGLPSTLTDAVVRIECHN